MSTESPTRAAEASTQRSPWTKLIVVLSAIVVAWAAFLTIVSGEVIPPIVVFAVLYLVTIYVVWQRPNKAGPIMAIIVSVGFLGGGAPNALDALPHPDSALDWILSLIQVVVPLAVIVASVAVLRGWAPSGRRTLVVATAGVVVVGSIFSIAAALGLEDDLSQAGDLSFVAEDTEFAPESISAAAGPVAVFVENADPIRHTFNIEALDVSLELPASTDRRIEFDAAPGTYEFFCDVPGHEDMKGTLIVSG